MDFGLLGLPDTAVQESRERVRAALRNSGCEFPLRRITVNLAPANLKKAGPAYNNTPRKCLGYRTPAEIFANQVLHLKCESTSRLSPGRRGQA